MSDNFAGTPESAQTIGITPKSAQTSTATVPMTPQQQLAEMRERNSTFSGGSIEPIDFDKAMLLDTLQAILDIEKKETCRIQGCKDKYKGSGYNQALADVAEVVKEGMGG